MGCAPVQFNYALWLQTFPELAEISQAEATAYFTAATLIQRNDGRGPIADPLVQLSLLNLLTSHLASVFPTGLNSAQSINIPAAFGTTESAQEAFCAQSTYGQAWWTQTAPYRPPAMVAAALQPSRPILGPGFGYGYGGSSRS